ncbi:YveK family protein [Acetobacterium woodii]|uniref:Capsular polysaccharide biosynthesis protein CpsC n=1 Tax=Acetobacterium woodii (strain ATCC 29683 / DSM 1030 / JCM 2381 / KCTC 1655 / WB1) TaxID=931626 RepID=H6LEK4_ACEWD|nr:Wzz/FepE/Etk N-terminal domain-containing protein [Acetobacterium woodii]AFA48107.1 capsular polysaccharide biosynthesis protein CpsC [Acetobacterium woodii DSM 1030]
MPDTTDQFEDEFEIDLLKLIKALWHKAWLIVLFALLGGGLVFIYTYFYVEPLYKSSAQMYVNNSSLSLDSAALSITSGDISASKSLVQTYIVILKSRQVLEEIIRKAQLDLTYEELSAMISAGSVSSTEVFEIVVTDTDPYRAEKIANTIAGVLPEKISSIVEGSSVRIVDYAVIPAAKSSPSLIKNSLIGALVGALICAGVIIVLVLKDTIIRDYDYLNTSYEDIPLLAIVPDMDSKTNNKNYYRSYK